MVENLKCAWESICSLVCSFPNTIPGKIFLEVGGFRNSRFEQQKTGGFEVVQCVGAAWLLGAAAVRLLPLTAVRV